MKIQTLFLRSAGAFSLFFVISGCQPFGMATPTIEPTDSNRVVTATLPATPTPEVTATPNFEKTSEFLGNTMKKDVQELVEKKVISGSAGSYYRVQDLTAEFAKLNYYNWWPLDRNPENFVIRADVDWELSSPGANYSKAGCGFVFHERGAGNLHFSFLSMDGYVRNIRMDKQIFTDLKANYAGKFQYPSDSAKIMLVVQNQTATFLVNNEVVVSYQDSRLTGGNLALAIASGTNSGFGTRCRFQNVELWEFD
jgi:hypothetical protein